MGRHGKEEPKNYFVPVPWSSRGKAAVTSPPTHEALRQDRWTGGLELIVEALSPLHVGTGFFDEQDGRLVKATILRRGEPVIPGSSIKGACRQLREALTGSGSPFEAKGDVSASLFGALGQRGRVSFDDAVPTEPVRLQTRAVRTPHSPLGGWRPRSPEGSKRNPRKKPRSDLQGRRFYGAFDDLHPRPGRGRIQVIPQHTRLRTALRFWNVEPFELGTVLAALGVLSCEEGFTPKLGGAKYETLGWVRYVPGEHQLRSGLGCVECGSDDAVWKEAADAARLRFGGREPWSSVLAACLERFRAQADLRNGR
ncbi:MAG: RAMP superfamily CRISPR-associated protein [Acidobacteriota bacterium]